MKDLYNRMIRRQQEIFTHSQQEKIRKTRLCIIGCGGLGGMIVEQLIRTGFENMTIIDRDVFDYTNLNRQIRSNTSTIGKSKSGITKNEALKINPQADITAYDTRITEENIETIIDGHDIVIDAVDNIYTRVLISRKTRQLNIPFIHSAVEKTEGQLTIFDNTTPGYEQLFRLKSQDKPLKESEEYLKRISSGKPQVLSTTPAIFACLEVNETIKYILDCENKILAPKVLMWNIFDLTSLHVVEF